MLELLPCSLAPPPLGKPSAMPEGTHVALCRGTQGEELPTSNLHLLAGHVFEPPGSPQSRTAAQVTLLKRLGTA